MAAEGEPPPAADGMSSDVRQDILSRIGDRVTQLLGAARKDSESKVKAELMALNQIMMKMDARIDELNSQLDEAEQPQQGGIEPTVVRDALAKMEKQWGKELGKLKQELHQTIFAHNHNADLMKRQKEALEGMRGEVDTSSSPAKDAERIKAAKQLLAKAEQVLKSQQKQKKLDHLFRRLTTIEQRLAVSRWPMGAGMVPGLGHPGLGMAGLGGMPPGMMGGLPGVPPGMPAAQLAAAAAAAGGRNPAAAAAMAAYGGHRGLMGQAAAAAAMQGLYPDYGDEEDEDSEGHEEVEVGRPPGLL